MVHKLPTNKEELVKCWGIKGKRAQQYGDSILRIINSYLQSLSGNNNQSRRQIQTTINFNPQSPPASQRTSNTRVASSTSATVTAPTTTARTTSSHPAAESNGEDDSDDDIIVTRRTLSIEEIVRQRVREAEARGEVFEILE